jgi:hypothetical protein
VSTDPDRREGIAEHFSELPSISGSGFGHFSMYLEGFGEFSNQNGICDRLIA